MPIDPSVQPGESPEPILPSSLPASTGAPPSAATTPGAVENTSTGLAPNVAAGLATVCTLISGIVFLLLEKRNPYVRFWAMQSVCLGVAWFIFAIVATVLGSILSHIFWVFGILVGLASAVVYLAFAIVWVVMMIKAFTGSEWEIPYLGKIAREQLAKGVI